MRNKKVLKTVQFALLLAIEAIVCFTPLGSLPALGPIVMTLGMIPIIITSVVMGIGYGSLMGFFAGLFSFIVWTFMPPSPIAFVFTPFYSLGAISGNFYSLLICFVPRILVGTVSGAIYAAMSKNKPSSLAYLLSGIVGSLMNTFGVMGGIYFFFGVQYASAIGIGYEALIGLIMTTVLTSGIPEAILGGICALAIGRPLRKYADK